MSLKNPYLDVRGLASEEAYKVISKSMEKQFYYKDKKSFPKYRCKQILNAITHASLEEEQKAELKKRLQQLRDFRNELPSDLNDQYRKNQILRDIKPVLKQVPKSEKGTNQAQMEDKSIHKVSPSKSTEYNLKYVGRFRNFEKKIEALKSNEEAIALYNKFVQLDFTINEMQSVLNFCDEIPQNQTIRTLAVNVENRLKREEEKMQQNTAAFIEKMKKPRRGPYVVYISTPMGGQNKRR